MNTNQVDAFVASRIKPRLSKRIKKLAAQANFDLYNGPVSSPRYPGFPAACERLSAVVDAIGEIWADPHVEWLSRKEPRHPERLDTVYRYERRDVARAIFGTVAGYF